LIEFIQHLHKENKLRHVIAALLFVGLLSLTSSFAVAQSQTREDMLRELTAKRAELQQLEQQFLAPSSEDLQAHAAFLSQPDTGLIRLLPRELYDSETYKKNKKTITMRGGGAYYSFSRRTHEYGFGSDIQLSSDHLSVGFAGADYGMLVNLGEVGLDEITLEHPRGGFISSYNPSSQEPKARLEARQFAGKGITVDDVEYRNRVPVKVNNTYLLRSIGYRVSDVLVAFKVVRQDTDGSVILAWKLLKKYPVPTLARSE
jgi:hypothetical protein